MQLAIRRAEPSDYEAIRSIYECKSVYSNTRQLPMPTAEQWRKKLSETSGNSYVLVALCDDKVVGHLAIEVGGRPRIAHVGSIGISVHEDFQSKGIGTALMKAALDLADNWLGLVRLQLTVYADNKAAIGMYKKLGFEVEGTHLAASLRNGKYADECAMARLHPMHPANFKAHTQAEKVS